MTRLARITDDLLVLARGDEDKLVTQPETTDIRVLLPAAPNGPAAGPPRRAWFAGSRLRLAWWPALIPSVSVRQWTTWSGTICRSPRAGLRSVLSGERSGTWLVLEVRDRGPAAPRLTSCPTRSSASGPSEWDRARGEGGGEVPAWPSCGPSCWLDGGRVAAAYR